MFLIRPVQEGEEKKKKPGYETPNLSFCIDKVKVRAEGMDADGNSVSENKDFTTVTFKNLVAHLYFINNAIAVKAQADSIGLDDDSDEESWKA